MSAPTAPLIMQFLAGRPLGATGAEIARNIDSPIRSVGQTLARLAERGDIHQLTEGTREEATWSLIEKDETPPIYSATQTLEAMRAVANRVFVAHAQMQRLSPATAKCTG